jgi:hypothetical protein
MADPNLPPREHLTCLVREALAISDQLGLHMVGIHLDAARVELTRARTVEGALLHHDQIDTPEMPQQLLRSRSSDSVQSLTQ